MVLLSWDLISLLSYATGEELSFNLHFEAPANTMAKKFYILGGLYVDTTYISGSLFGILGILKAAEVDYGVNSATYISLWTLEPGESVELPCRFVFNRSDCLLALFLMRMGGDEVNIDADEAVAQIRVQLIAPRLAWEQVQDVVSRNIMPIAAIGLLLGMVGVMTDVLVRKKVKGGKD